MTFYYYIILVVNNSVHRLISIAASCSRVSFVNYSVIPYLKITYTIW